MIFHELSSLISVRLCDGVSDIDVFVGRDLHVPGKIERHASERSELLANSVGIFSEQMVLRHFVDLLMEFQI